MTQLKFGFLSILVIFSTLLLATDDVTYLQKVSYPSYDASNPDHVLIQSDSDWAKINGAAHYYYVKPGDYRSAGRVTLRAQGTDSAKRYIVLADGKDTHPARLQTSEQANVWLSFVGGDHWVIDRISSIDISTGNWLHVYSFRYGASDNLLNRLHIKDYIDHGITFFDGSNDNTVQQCRIADMTLEGRKRDRVSIGFASDGHSNINSLNNKIIQNEIVNTNDGIQLVSSRALRNVNFAGTVIDGNLIWLTPDLYVNGIYAYAENAIDLKAASMDADNPVVITNNIMWGFRKNAQDGDPGDAVTMHYGFSNLIFEDNVIFDSHRGIGASSGGVHDSSFKRNILYECNRHTATNYALYLYDSSNLQIEENIIVDTISGYGANIQNNVNSTFKRNVLISSGTSIQRGSLDASENRYYNTANRINGVNDVSYSNASDANMGDFTFTYDNYTNDPKQKNLYGVLPADSILSAGINNTSVSEDGESEVMQDDIMEIENPVAFESSVKENDVVNKKAL